MTDFFRELREKLNSKNCSIEILSCDVLECRMNYPFDLFQFGVSDSTKYIYNNYKKFSLKWEERKHNLKGFVHFVPYEEIVKENKEICKIIDDIEGNITDEQKEIINDLVHWYPIFKFPNGDAFCYDKRNGKVVFYEHEVFDTGINLHGIIIADTIDTLLDRWSKVLFVDIYDWYEGINEQGIDLSKAVYEKVLQIGMEISH